MRLDKYLKESRIIKRRTIAKEFCDRGLVKINNKVAKPSLEIKEGDTIEIKLGDKLLKAIIKIELKGKREIAGYEPC